LALQQKLTITSRGQIREVELLLEADAQAVRLAAVDLGQTAVRLEWDGTTLTQSRAPWWPEAISSERILSDLQLMLWPAAAIAAALPAGWALETDAAGRTLNHQGMPVARVSWLGKTVSELDHYVDGYRIRVESRAVEGSP
jgi:hypothetical protein